MVQLRPKAPRRQSFRAWSKLRNVAPMDQIWLSKTRVAAFGRKPHPSIFRSFRRSSKSPLRSAEW